MDHPSNGKLALHATLHCLLGCGIGEVAGVIIGVALGLSAFLSIAVGVVLGFVFGFLLGVIPLTRVGKTFKDAFRIVFLADFISIVVMETGEVLAEVFIPGVLTAPISEPLFWFGMAGALTTGFIFAYPVNFFSVRRGMKHHFH